MQKFFPRETKRDIWGSTFGANGRKLSKYFENFKLFYICYKQYNAIIQKMTHLIKKHEHFLKNGSECSCFDEFLTQN